MKESIPSKRMPPQAAQKPRVWFAVSRDFSALEVTSGPPPGRWRQIQRWSNGESFVDGVYSADPILWHARRGPGRFGALRTLVKRHRRNPVIPAGLGFRPQVLVRSAPKRLEWRPDGPSTATVHFRSLIMKLFA